VTDRQFDLFAAGGTRPTAVSRETLTYPPLDPVGLDDAALIAALPWSGLADCQGLAAEAGRRGLLLAVPALEALCRRFKGFGVDHAVPEQTAVLQALGAIGGRAAAEAVSRIIVDGVVMGPGLVGAVGAAAQLGCSLPAGTLSALLRHADPRIRADACRCTRRSSPKVISRLLDLLDDLNSTAARAAACALGRCGRAEARPMLANLLREDPSAEVIEAAASIADEECIVLLGRIARAGAGLAETALDALEAMDHPRAAAIAAAIRTLPAE
jgi:hypothetical protein